MKGDLILGHEIELPSQLIEPLLILAAEQEVSVEEIVERAIQNFIEGSAENGD